MGAGDGSNDDRGNIPRVITKRCSSRFDKKIARGRHVHRLLRVSAAFLFSARGLVCTTLLLYGENACSRRGDYKTRAAPIHRKRRAPTCTFKLSHRNTLREFVPCSSCRIWASTQEKEGDEHRDGDEVIYRGACVPHAVCDRKRHSGR